MSWEMEWLEYLEFVSRWKLPRQSWKVHSIIAAIRHSQISRLMNVIGQGVLWVITASACPPCHITVILSCRLLDIQSVAYCCSHHYVGQIVVEETFQDLYVYNVQLHDTCAAQIVHIICVVHSMRGVPRTSHIKPIPGGSPAKFGRACSIHRYRCRHWLIKCRKK